MSYPAPIGFGTNLSCDTSLQRNNDAFLFQLNDGAATNESTLVSPASITPPAANGNVSLAMTTTTPGDSTLIMQGQDTIINMNNQGGVNQINMQGNNTAINLTSNADATLGLVGGGAGQPGASSSTILLGSVGALGVNDILFGNPSTTGIALYQTTTTPGQLSVGNNFTSTNIASFNQTTNNVVLGSLLSAGTVNLNAATVIKDNVSPANGLGLSPTGINTSSINQLVATTGILSIGSSLSNATSLQVADLAGDATVYVRSTDGQTPLEIRSNNTGSSIIPGTPAAGNITIGSSGGNPSGLTITDTATTINKLGGAPQVLLATGNLPPSTPLAPFLFTFPAPTGEGLYAICGSSSGVSTANSRQAQLSCFCYVNNAGNVAIGGAGYADLGAVGSDDNIQFAPISNNSFSGSYGGVQQVNNFSVLAFKLSGPIPGTF